MCEVVKWIEILFLTVISVWDIRKKEIPFIALLMMSGVMILARIFLIDESIVSTLGGILVGILFFAMSKCTGESIGYGDSWIILLLGIYLGGKKIVELVLIASFVACVFSLICCAKNGWKRKQTIPFVPFLTIAYLGVVML